MAWRAFAALTGGAFVATAFVALGVVALLVEEGNDSGGGGGGGGGSSIDDDDERAVPLHPQRARPASTMMIQRQLRGGMSSDNNSTSISISNSGLATETGGDRGGMVGLGDAEINQEGSQQDTATGTQRNTVSANSDADAMVDYGRTLYDNHLVKNSNDGCPICLQNFNGELLRSYSVVLPCGEHALCANCTYKLKIQADKAEQDPKCPLCRFSFSGDFIEGIPSVIVKKDKMIANLIVQLPNMGHDEKIAVAERLLWTHRFEVTAVVDAIEELLDGQARGIFLRSEGDLTHKQKEDIYRKARLPVEKLEEKLKQLLQEQRLADSESLNEMYRNIQQVRKVRKELRKARQRAREDVYSKMNNVGTMGAEQEHGMIQVDYHGQHVSGMRKLFKDHIIPIIPAVGKVMVITGRGSHSVGKESKLKKALCKMIGEYDNLHYQGVKGNDGAIIVLWRAKK